MGIEIVAGRDFAAGDFSPGAEEVILNQSLARRIWPNGRAVGERLSIGCDTQTTAMVVGVVSDSAITGLGGPAPQLHLYRPSALQDSGA